MNTCVHCGERSSSSLLMKILIYILVTFPAVTDVYAHAEKGKGSYKQPAICTKLPDRGPCRANVTYWFFQAKYSECKLFNYGGCGGNGNRFWTEKKCYNRCAAPDRRKLLCSVHPEPKPCNSTFQAWYFDHRDNACHKLPRGMCTSTVNRFLWCEKCMSRCSVENARETCRREYTRMKQEENSIQQASASRAPGGSAIVTPPGLPLPGAGFPAPTPPPEGTAQRQPENVFGPVAQAPNISMLPPLLPGPTPNLVGVQRGQSDIVGHENGLTGSGTTGTAPTAGAVVIGLQPNVHQTHGTGEQFPDSFIPHGPTAGGSDSPSGTNSLGDGRPRRVVVVAVIKPPEPEHGITSLGIRGHSGEITDGAKGHPQEQSVLK
uniref:Pancreatic trypsin inhibitor n=1 Tax=Rhipicephalus zambeziensis TaxID=60191 RepID=A0A224Y2E6_9ACAR